MIYVLKNIYTFKPTVLTFLKKRQKLIVNKDMCLLQGIFHIETGQLKKGQNPKGRLTHQHFRQNSLSGTFIHITCRY